MSAIDYCRRVASIETKRKSNCLSCEQLNKTSFFRFKIVTNFILNFQFLRGLETNLWLQDRDLIGTIPRPRPCLNIRDRDQDQDHKNLVSRPPALKISLYW